MSDVPTWARAASMAAVALIASAACGGEATSPGATLLLGQWGSATTLLVALHSGAEVQFGCAVLVIDGPSCEP